MECYIADTLGMDCQPGGERHAQLLAPPHNGEVRPQMCGQKLGKLADYVENSAETASLAAWSLHVIRLEFKKVYLR